MEKETEYLLTPISIAVVNFKKLETICRWNGCFSVFARTNMNTSIDIWI